MKRAILSIALACVLLPGLGLAQDKPHNSNLANGAQASDPRLFSGDLVDTLEIPSVDVPAALFEDTLRQGTDLPPRYAIPTAVNVNLRNGGTWEQLERGTWVWRLRIVAEGATSLNLGFTRFFLTSGAELSIYDARNPSRALPAFTQADNDAHGELWTPPLAAEELMLELRLPPKEIRLVELELGQVGYGYRGFGAVSPSIELSGSCNVDVVCPEGNDWDDEIPSVGVISLGGSTFCSGVLVNNTSEDGTPLFLTAFHCGVNAGNAASLIVFWNYENSTCRPPGSGASGGAGDGSLAQFTTGSTFRAGYSPSDFTLVELDDDPSGFDVTYSGWDRSGANASSAVAIHHPATDEKRISFEDQPTTITSYLGASVPGDGTHIRVEDWDLGTTEGGSSGSPLYDSNHRVIGQLHGGFAACGNNDDDWYGAISVSWNGGGTSATRLSDWLDPGATGAMTLDTRGATGMRVTPGTPLAASGGEGGPFTPSSQAYTLSNKNTTPIDYSVTTGASWVTITGGSGQIPGLGDVVVTASINGNANALTTGLYDDTIQFTNLTDGDGDTQRAVSVEVGTLEFASTDTPLAIPDGTNGTSTPGSVSSTITLQQPGVKVADVDVELDIAHTYMGDLCISLTHNGQTVVLVERANSAGGCFYGTPYGCSADNYSGAIIDDSGSGGDLESQCAAGLSSPPNYTPTGSLATFQGMALSGDWTLTVTDNAGSDLGTVLGWALRVIPESVELGARPFGRVQ